MVASQVVLFVRIFGEVVELNVGRKYRSPNQLPIALTQGRAKRLDIIDNLSAGGRFALANSRPDIHSIKRLAFGGGSAGEGGEGRIHVHGVNHSVDGPGLDVPRPVSQRTNSRSA